jgi:hypothetical protein
VWFEPERVAAGTQIARERPEFVFGGANGGLFKLNDPAARRWLTELLSLRITEFDLESVSRSVPLWRSDTGCSPGHADWDQVQALGLSQYVPLSTSCAWEPTAYVLRSAATGGSITQFDYLNDRFSIEEARLALAEVKENQRFWYGDFYPLTRADSGPDPFVAWQLHRADLNAGIVLAFRRSGRFGAKARDRLHLFVNALLTLLELGLEMRVTQPRLLQPE